MKECAFTFETVEMLDADSIAISFLYKTIPGRVILKLLIRPTVSKLAGSILKSPATRIFISGFVKRNSINMEEYQNARYRSFNDFFIREIREEFRPFPENKHDVATPCDGKLTAHPITTDSVFHIKNSKYSVCDLLQDSQLAADYTDGVCLIFRLTPDDYHRYSFIDDGEIIDRKRIKGILHTVRPIAHQRCSVFCRNSREYTVIQTTNFGKIVQIEVGAIFVGRITNYNDCREIKRGGEKGMFQFGGSTVIMLFQKGAITVDDAIYENTIQNKETKVRMGCKIGEKKIPGMETPV